MTEAMIAAQNMMKAMQLEMERVLMDGELDADRLNRLEQMVRGCREFMLGLFPKSIVVHVNGGELSPEAQKIRDARFRALGFETSHLHHLIHDPIRDAAHREATEGLIRAAQTFGVGEEEGDEDEEVELLPSVDNQMLVPVGLVRDVVRLLKGTDGDVAEQLGELLEACAVTEQTAPDAMMPIELGHAVTGCIGLAALKSEDSRKVGGDLYVALAQASPSWATQVNGFFERRSPEA